MKNAFYKILIFLITVSVFVLPSPNLTSAANCATGTMVGATCVIILTTGYGGGNQTWNVPSDWNNSNNSVACVGSGGYGGVSVASGRGAGGGGGGAFASTTNVSLSPSGTTTYAIGASATTTTETNAVNNARDTWFGSTASSSASVSCAHGKRGGDASTSAVGTGGAGGLASASKGTLTANGGSGASGRNSATTPGGGGGGGSGGPKGDGKGSTQPTSGASGAGSGGGGSNGSLATAGSVGSSGTGGDGGDGGGGSGHGTGGGGGSGGGGATANSGAGGGGAGAGGTPGGQGATDQSFDSSHGAGGGGGGGGSASGVGGAGAAYGGGAGGDGGAVTSTTGSGGEGVIAIMYVPTTNYPTIYSASNQKFTIGQSSTTMSPLTITASSTSGVNTTGNIRVAIATTSGFYMEWDTSVTSATITGSASGKVSSTVSYPSPSELLITVSSNFSFGDSIVVSGLKYKNFTAPAKSGTGAFLLYAGGSTAGLAGATSTDLVTISAAGAAGGARVTKINLPPNYLSSANGLLAWWTFDGKYMYQNVADSSGNGNTGYWFGGATTTVPGKLGQALSFNGTSNYIGNGGVGVSAPQFLEYASTTAWQTSGLATQSVTFANVNSGDVLVAYLMDENDLYTFTLGGQYTWTLQQSVVGQGNFSNSYIWTATATSTQSLTVTATCSNGASCDRYGFVVERFTNSNGIGVSNVAHDGTTGSKLAPTVTLTGVSAHSAIVVSNSDWSAGNGAYTWRTNAGSFTSQTYYYLNNVYTVYGGYHPDVSTAGNYAVGLSAPTQVYSLIGVEVLGGGASSGLNLSNVQTVSFWAKPTTTTQSIINLDATKNIAISAGTVQANNVSGAVVYVDGVQTATFPNTNWHFVTVTTNTPFNATTFRIGNVSNYYGGLLDDVRVYSRALSAAEVLNLYRVGAAKMNANSASAPSGALAQGLVGYWTFDGKDTINNVTDRSGSGNTGYLMGFTSTSSAQVAGKIGQALSFNGTNNYVYLPNLSGLSTNAITATAWVKINPTTASYVSIASRAGTCGSDQFSFDISSANQLYAQNIRLYSESASPDHKSSNGTIALGTWQFVTVTYDKANVTFYINGKLDSQFGMTGGLNSTCNTTSIGRYGMDDQNYFPGSLDDVRIYNRALSDTEILQLYRLGSVRIKP